MKRFVDIQLKNWARSTRRKPLLVRGARQVGKTYSIRQLAKGECFERLIEVNFEKTVSLHSIFQGDLEPSQIIKNLELALDCQINLKKDLLFFDEIQFCPQAIMSLRYFYEQLPELAVVAAGSMLEFVLQDISFPVGRVQFLDVTPLSFWEFLLARGKRLRLEALLEKPQEIDFGLYSSFWQDLQDYFWVGGMPEAVDQYLQTDSYASAFEVHQEILETYFNDFSKYKPRIDPLCLREVLQNTATKVGQQIKYAHLSEMFDARTSKKALHVLSLVRLLCPIQATHALQAPLPVFSSKSRHFKVLFLDVGLMHSMAGLKPSMADSAKELLALYRGALAEQFIGQELCFIFGRELHYWKRDKKNSEAELDYLVQHQGDLYPVEVKSGLKGTLRSLHMVLGELEQNDAWGYVFSHREFADLADERIHFCPLFSVYSMFASEGLKAQWRELLRD